MSSKGMSLKGRINNYAKKNGIAQLIKSRSENTNLSGAFRMDIPVISFLWIDSGISRKVFIISMDSTENS